VPPGFPSPAGAPVVSGDGDAVAVVSPLVAGGADVSPVAASLAGGALVAVDALSSSPPQAARMAAAPAPMISWRRPNLAGNQSLF